MSWLYPLLRFALVFGLGILSLTATLRAAEEKLPNLDKRARKTQKELAEARRQGLDHLAELAPEAQVDFEPITGSPRWISSREGFLSGPDGSGKAITLKAH